MGMSPSALESFFEEFGEKRETGTYNKLTGSKISAMPPMHTFGFMCRIDEIKKICLKWKINLIEDSAEALGSQYKLKYSGTFGLLSAYSFNGNKIITSGGGGCITTQDEELFKELNISLQLQNIQNGEYIHDEVGYNRMPNINAALACAQLESFQDIIKNKKN